MKIFLTTNLFKYMMFSIIGVSLFFGMLLTVLPKPAEAAMSSVELQSEIDRLTAIIADLTSQSPTSVNTVPVATSVSAFRVGDNVKTTARLSVRNTPSGLLLGIVKKGSEAVITGGPVMGSNHVWWKLQYSNGMVGWSAENWLDLVSMNQEDITVKVVDTSAKITKVSSTPAGEHGEFEIEMSVTAGSEDIYVYSDQSGKDGSLRPVIYNTGNFQVTEDFGFTLQSTAKKVNSFFFIPKGLTANIKVVADFAPEKDGYYYMNLYQLPYVVGAPGGTVSEINLGDATTDSVYIKGSGASKIVTSCNVWVDKEVYTYGEDVHVSWNSNNASYMTFVNDTSGKDNISVPGDKFGSSGSTVLKADATGYPYVTMKAYGKNDATAECVSKFRVVEEVAVADIQVTAPNGGEKWIIGQTNTITWSPYDYNPDVNPANDVDVYLEKKVGKRFITIGKVMDQGKASLHTYFEIDRYGNYAKPGKYYVKAVNRVTGAWDRSDKPFTLVEKQDIQVTAPNGGEEWVIGQTNTITWSPYNYNPDVNPAKDVDVYLERKIGNRFRRVGKIMDQGKASLHTYFEIDRYGNYAKPGKYYVKTVNRVTGAWDRSDRPFTLLATSTGQVLGVSTSRDETGAFIEVLSPNGTEKFATGDFMDIKWNATGVDRMSIALYKDNKWFYWIKKDMPLSEVEKGEYKWQIPNDIFNRVGTTDSVLKIYTNAHKTDITGYVDDKSDHEFSFVETSNELDSDVKELTQVIKQLINMLK